MVTCRFGVCFSFPPNIVTQQSDIYVYTTVKPLIPNPNLGLMVHPALYIFRLLLFSSLCISFFFFGCFRENFHYSRAQTLDRRIMLIGLHLINCSYLNKIFFFLNY